MRTPDGRIQLRDISDVGPVVAIKRGDKEVRVWACIWYLLASDGGDWHNALQFACLSGPTAARVAALSLHHFDISSCERLLKEYHSKLVNEYTDVSLALWIAVITKFMSCFQASAARPKLDPTKVYGVQSAELQDFELLEALRNKHVVHDENSHYNASAFTWLEPNGDVFGVGPMMVVARIDPVLVTKVANLVLKAQTYIQKAMEDAAKALLAQVKAMTAEERAALPKSVYFPVPIEDDIKKKR